MRSAFAFKAASTMQREVTIDHKLANKSLPNRQDETSFESNLMAEAQTESNPPQEAVADFRTTHWSVVLEANQTGSTQAAAALEQLCRTYWLPLYVYVRRQGHSPHDAQDLTQEFFARLLRLESLKAVAPSKGKFRTFLVVSLNHFLADSWDAAKAQKRAANRALPLLDDETAEELYQLEHARAPTPDVAYDRRWILTLLEQALSRLREESAATGKLQQFEHLKGFLGNPTEDGEYDRAASELAMRPQAVAVAVHRLRQRYRDLVRAEIAHTVSSAQEMAEELSYLFGR